MRFALRPPAATTARLGSARAPARVGARPKLDAEPLDDRADALGDPKGSRQAGRADRGDVDQTRRSARGLDQVVDAAPGRPQTLRRRRSARRPSIAGHIARGLGQDLRPRLQAVPTNRPSTPGRPLSGRQRPCPSQVGNTSTPFVRFIGTGSRIRSSDSPGGGSNTRNSPFRGIDLERVVARQPRDLRPHEAGAVDRDPAVNALGPRTFQYEPSLHPRHRSRHGSGSAAWRRDAAPRRRERWYRRPGR